MSKDKGGKNHKKAPADKSLSKGKSLSTYKNEGQKDKPGLDVFTEKTDPKTVKKTKSSN